MRGIIRQKRFAPRNAAYGMAPGEFEEERWSGGLPIARRLLEDYRGPT